MCTQGSTGIVNTVFLLIGVGVICLLNQKSDWDMRVALPGGSILRSWLNRDPILFQPLISCSQRLFTLAAFACRVLVSYYYNENAAVNLHVPRVRQPVQAMTALIPLSN